MTVEAIVSELERRGIQLFYKSGKFYSRPAVPTDLLQKMKKHKAELTKTVQQRGGFVPTKPSSRRVIAAAVKRLELGETQVARIHSHTLGGQVLLLREDDIPESITVDCPTFTVAELQEVIGAGRSALRTAYLLKLEFPGTKVVGSYDGER